MADAPRLVVREVSAARRWLWVILGAAAFGCASYGLYLLMRAQLPYDWGQVELERERMAAQRSELNREISRLRDENAELAEQIVMLQRGNDIDREATAELRTTIRDLQAELEAQREQLAFYRGIVSPDESKAGMRVYELRVQDSDTEAQRYGFDLMLIQAVRHNRLVSGRVSLSVQGVRDGEDASLSASDLGLDRAGKLDYSFRYFQELRGSFRLPEDFAPTGVTVTVHSNGGGDFDKQFNWAEVRQTSGEKHVGQEQG